MVGGNPKGVTCDVAEHHGVHASVLRRHRRQELVAVRRHMNALANGRHTTQRQKENFPDCPESPIALEVPTGPSDEVNCTDCI